MKAICIFEFKEEVPEKIVAAQVGEAVKDMVDIFGQQKVESEMCHCVQKHTVVFVGLRGLITFMRIIFIGGLVNKVARLQYNYEEFEI